MRKTLFGAVGILPMLAGASLAAQQTPPDWTGYYTLATARDLAGVNDTGQVCLPDGIFRYPSMAGRFLGLQEPERIVMVFGIVNTAGVRRIYLLDSELADDVCQDQE